ncbi:hypothetical protein COSO111634_36455 [Corallococcus soli]
MPRFVHAGASFGDRSSRALSAVSAMLSSPRRAISTARVKSFSWPEVDLGEGAASFASGADLAAVLGLAMAPAVGPVSAGSVRVAGAEAQADSQSVRPVSVNRWRWLIARLLPSAGAPDRFRCARGPHAG